jgi:hypothetical protein
VGTVSASGFSSTIMNYSFTDANPLNGINYYRLVMVDKDKASDYSNVVSISSKHNQTLNIVSAQLSSSTSNLTLAVNATQSVKTLLMVFDANGRSILNTPVMLQSGVNKIEKNTSFAPKGIYFVKLVSADEGIVKNILATE